VVPQLFVAGGNRSYIDLWAITRDLWYSRYMTSIVALVPSIERIAGAVHLMGGRIGIHMLLLMPSRDLVVRPWG
jgi:hypothetical protein